ncbi:hypothetical protein [Cupriavidus pauculus]|uniref:Uncharacterized protein n=1 Tax=Cupriavidus pauculus TaxID=82633 RepID=A0A2N5C9H8_9BURK|nr:hypothetical protein [Cupriavidus pauculus]PLP98882.1 hypothetical protein CYJ10_19025 [Cupriavidus pauculus]
MGALRKPKTDPVRKIVRLKAAKSQTKAAASANVTLLVLRINIALWIGHAVMKSINDQWPGIPGFTFLTNLIAHLLATVSVIQ